MSDQDQAITINESQQTKPTNAQQQQIKQISTPTQFIKKPIPFKSPISKDNNIVQSLFTQKRPSQENINEDKIADINSPLVKQAYFKRINNDSDQKNSFQSPIGRKEIMNTDGQPHQYLLTTIQNSNEKLQQNKENEHPTAQTEFLKSYCSPAIKFPNSYLSPYTSPFLIKNMRAMGFHQNKNDDQKLKSQNSFFQLSMLSPAPTILNNKETPNQMKNREIDLSGKRRLFQSPSQNQSLLQNKGRMFQNKLEDILEEDIIMSNIEHMESQRIDKNLDIIMNDVDDLSSFGHKNAYRIYQLEYEKDLMYTTPCNNDLMVNQSDKKYISIQGLIDNQEQLENDDHTQIEQKLSSKKQCLPQNIQQNYFNHPYISNALVNKKYQSQFYKQDINNYHNKTVNDQQYYIQKLDLSKSQFYNSTLNIQVQNADSESNQILKKQQYLYQSQQSRKMNKKLKGSTNKKSDKNQNSSGMKRTFSQFDKNSNTKQQNQQISKMNRSNQKSSYKKQLNQQQLQHDMENLIILESPQNQRGYMQTPKNNQFTPNQLSLSDTNSQQKRELMIQKLLQSDKQQATKFVCNCKKSQCLKLYCDCFAYGGRCGPECNCIDCNNSANNEFDQEDRRKQAIEAILDRNPNAFLPKIKTANQNEGQQDNGFHLKGCHCKKSGCQKKYCECYQSGVICTNLCICEGCRNCDDAQYKEYQESIYESQIQQSYKKEDNIQENQLSESKETSSFLNQSKKKNKTIYNRQNVIKISPPTKKDTKSKPLVQEKDIEVQDNLEVEEDKKTIKIEKKVNKVSNDEQKSKVTTRSQRKLQEK